MPDISPLFAVDAEELLAEGLISDAILLLKKGIVVYPDYFAGYALLIKALLKNNDASEATIYLDLAEELFPNHTALENSRNSIPQIKEDDNSFLIDNEIEEDVLIIENIEDTKQIENIEINNDFSLDVEVDDEFVEEENVDVEEENEILYEGNEDIYEGNEDVDEGNEVLEEENEDHEEENEVLEEENEDIEINDNSILDKIRFYSEEIVKSISSPDNVYLKKGFLKIINNMNYSSDLFLGDFIEAENREVLTGLFDYDFNYINVSEPNNKHKKLNLIADFDIHSIEKKYTKNIISHDDFAFLAEKIKLIDIKAEESDDLGQSDELSDEKIEDVAPVTETMANIFVLQKSYGKAIKLYKHLIELHPEKADVFEEKINKVMEMAEDAKNTIVE